MLFEDPLRLGDPTRLRLLPAALPPRGTRLGLLRAPRGHGRAWISINPREIDEHRRGKSMKNVENPRKINEKHGKS